MYVELKTKEQNQPMWPGGSACLEAYALVFHFQQTQHVQISIQSGEGDRESACRCAITIVFLFISLVYLFFIYFFISVFIYLFTVNSLLNTQGRYVPERLVKITQG